MFIAPALPLAEHASFQLRHIYFDPSCDGSTSDSRSPAIRDALGLTPHLSGLPLVGDTHNKSLIAFKYESSCEKILSEIVA